MSLAELSQRSEYPETLLATGFSVGLPRIWCKEMRPLVARENVLSITDML